MTYNRFFVSGSIWTNEVSFERALKTESNELWKKLIRHLESEFQTPEPWKTIGRLSSSGWSQIDVLIWMSYHLLTRNFQLKNQFFKALSNDTSFVQVDPEAKKSCISQKPSFNQIFKKGALLTKLPSDETDLWRNNPLTKPFSDEKGLWRNWFWRKCPLTKLISDETTGHRSKYFPFFVWIA